MTVGGSPAVARYRLRLALRQAREACGLTQRKVATSLDWSLSKVNRIEAGEVHVSGTDLQAMLRLFDVEEHRIAVLVEQARAARRRGWWDQPEYRERLTPALIESLQFEADSTAIRSFQPTLIPGTLQTRAYAASILNLWKEEIPEAVRAARVEARMRRRDQLLHRGDPPAYLLVLDESVLLREVGGPRVMSEQLSDLLHHIRAGRISARVASLTQATGYAAYGLFTIYTIDDEDVALYREGPLGDETIYDLDVVQRHRRRFDEVWEQALNEAASSRLIEARAAAMRTALDR